jgi:hypothetical protein
MIQIRAPDCEALNLRGFQSIADLQPQTRQAMNPSDQAPTAEEALHIPHDEFSAGLPAGRFNVIVNPVLAQKYVRHRLFVIGISLPLLGVGAALALSGYVWAGLPLVAAGFLLPRVIKAQAPKILLYLAQHDAKTYFEAMNFGILEVRHR